MDINCKDRMGRIRELCETWSPSDSQAELQRVLNSIQSIAWVQCELCGAEMEEGEGEKTLGLVCDECTENNEWNDDEG